MREENEAEILARIDATRARMGETIEQIGERVNPGRVQAELKARARDQVNEVKTNVKNRARSAMRDFEHGVNDAGRGVWDTIRDNPIPAGMVGVGLAWLAANGVNTARHRRWQSRDRYVTGYTGYAADRELYGSRANQEPYDTGVSWESGEEDRGRMAEARDELKEKASHAKERVSETAERVQERASHLMDSTRERTSDLAHRAGDATRNLGYRARGAERRVEASARENPMAAAAISAALGFAAGLMVPETEREQEMLGPARDRLMEKAERSVKRAGDKAREAVRESAGEAARHVVDEVMHSRDRTEGDQGSSSMTEPRR